MEQRNMFNVEEELRQYLKSESIILKKCFELEKRASFKAPVVYELLLANDSEFFFNVTGQNRQTLYKPDNRQAADMYNELGNQKISMKYGDTVMGLDGTSYTFKMENGFNYINITWWEKGPDEWYNLVSEIFSIIKVMKKSVIIKRKTTGKYLYQV